MRTCCFTWPRPNRPPGKCRGRHAALQQALAVDGTHQPSRALLANGASTAERSGVDVAASAGTRHRTRTVTDRTIAATNRYNRHVAKSRATDLPRRNL